MEWFVILEPVPNALEFGVEGGVFFWLTLIVALVPVFLAARHALTVRKRETPQLRVIEGGRELGARAA